MKPYLRRIICAFVVALALLSVATEVVALPTFARRYATSCATCHMAYPRLNSVGESFRLFEEWYTFKKIRTDIHVILALETEGMLGRIYDRPPLPATWARIYGRGRVFYTSLGHREDVWTSKIFAQIVLGGLAWAMGNVDADVTPNFNQVTPRGRQHERVPPEPGTVSR